MHIHTFAVALQSCNIHFTAYGAVSEFFLARALMAFRARDLEKALEEGLGGALHLVLATVALFPG